MKYLWCFLSLQTFHAELHTYKHHIELFNQLTQKLIAVYPADDTSRIKRMTESVNLRQVFPPSFVQPRSFLFPSLRIAIVASEKKGKLSFVPSWLQSLFKKS